MQIGDLVGLKSNPEAMGIVVSFYTDIYNEGDEYHESRWEMAMVQWNISNYLSAFEVSRLEVIA
jgi:S-formylglutathione hydrolase FrmB